jgi:hypothetical protein
MNAYRAYAKDKRCVEGDHVPETVEVLKGGAGPDGAAEQVTCARGCGAWGWRWCDGSVSWR